MVGFRRGVHEVSADCDPGARRGTSPMCLPAQTPAGTGDVVSIASRLRFFAD
jgi:hypothetical protein